ncbi:hypothetical protein IMZ29_00670 [Achromobacter sp. GG226]|uniref:hypothetical protein n=1 Tax=Verticiella alkaliphila TaxID=2779529 RepID=UPI001C0DCBB6|nr:hypothetical protein [Verticiella sp. GG226]MBU4609115.1 hypothetical protein [Verticiella sp. GG226]
MTEPFVTDNGVLRRLPGGYAADAIKLLPDPAACEKDRVSVEADGGPDLGRVLLTFKRMTARSGKHRHRFWACIRADQLHNDAPF